MHHDASPHSPIRCTVGHVQAHVIGLAILAVTVAFMLGGHNAIWGTPAFTVLDEVYASNAFFVAIGLALIVHEILHAIGFRYLGGAPWATIRLGVQWRTITPFARASVPVTRERIYHEAGAHTPEGMTFGEILRLVKDAGKRPVERNVHYQELRSW